MEKSRREALLYPILAGGFAAGVLDLVAASGQTLMGGGNLLRLGQRIASGWLGNASYEGGVATAALGYASHFLIATIWATVFVLAAQRIRFLFAAPLASGPLYGVLVWLMMRYVVLPLSAYPHPRTV